MPAFLFLLGLVIGVLFGVHASQEGSANRCQKMGKLYINSNVYECKQAEKRFQRRPSEATENMQVSFSMKSINEISNKIRELEAQIATASAQELAAIDAQLDALYQQLQIAQSNEFNEQ